ncbi:Crooked neck-like protein 1, partial [Bonamia ostreae]
MNQFKDNVETDPKTSYHKSGRNLKKEKVLNKAPSDRQITAEQIIREAYEHRVDEFKPQSHRISNEEELKAYQLSNRVEFEQKLRRQPHSINCWLRYAKWEESQKEWERVRSIYERALNVDYQNRGIWLKYAEFEMKNRFPNHARNVWDRAVKLLPRTDQLW